MLLGARSWRCYPARGRQLFPAGRAELDSPAGVPGRGGDAQREEANLTPRRGSRSGAGGQRSWNPQPSPLRPIQVLSKEGPGVSREPEPPSLCGPGSEHLMREPCRVVRGALGPRNPGEQGGPAPVTPGRHAASALVGAGGRGSRQRFPQPRGASRVLLRDRGDSRLPRGLVGPQVAHACTPHCPLRTKCPEAQRRLDAVWKFVCLRIAGLRWSRPLPDSGLQKAGETPQPAQEPSRRRSVKARPGEAELPLWSH